MDSLKEIEKQIFDKRFEWSKIDKGKALENTHVLDLVRESCLIESYFGVYVGHMIEMFWYDLEATSMFTIEAFEAYTHYYILRKYLAVVGYKEIFDDEIIQLRENDRDRKYNDEIKELVNFMATEHFAANFFKDLSDLATEPILKKILLVLSDQEVVHSQFAFDLLSKRLKKNPEIKDKILNFAKDFQHVGAYVLPAVSKVKEDNLKIIQSFNKKVANLVGESVSENLTRKTM